MEEKRASVAQRRPTKMKTVEKVSVLMPVSVHRKVFKLASADRRALSAQIVVLVQESLAAREAVAA